MEINDLLNIEKKAIYNINIYNKKFKREINEFKEYRSSPVKFSRDKNQYDFIKELGLSKSRSSKKHENSKYLIENIITDHPNTKFILSTFLFHDEIENEVNKYEEEDNYACIINVEDLTPIQRIELDLFYF